MTTVEIEAPQQPVRPPEPDVSRMPRRTPAPGQTLVLEPGQWEYPQPGEGGMRFRVDVVRGEISLWYGGEAVWVEGFPLDRNGWPAGLRRQILVRCDAIPELPTRRPQ